MPFLNWRLTDEPNYYEILTRVERAIGDVIRGQLGPDFTQADWAIPINKDRPAGLGLGDQWGMFVRQIVEQRLYRDAKYGQRFRVTEVTEAYIDSTKKQTLNDLERDLVTTAMLGKPHSRELIT